MIGTHFAKVNINILVGQYIHVETGGLKSDNLSRFQTNTNYSKLI